MIGKKKQIIYQKMKFLMKHLLLYLVKNPAKKQSKVQNKKTKIKFA